MDKVHTSFVRRPAAMAETSLSLLDRLRGPPDAGAWQQLVEIYSPLIRGWLRRQAAIEGDWDDLVQEVLLVLVRKLPEFQRDPRPGAFRRWLQSITVNCLRDAWRARRVRPAAGGGSQFQNLLDQLCDPHSSLSLLFEQEHNRHVLGRLLALIQPQFAPKTWQAFQRVAMDGIAPDRVAAELGISVNAVFIAKSRVITQLRRVGQGLID
jgi:RNA polymerase sigma-70 factor, ECF subfamily